VEGRRLSQPPPSDGHSADRQCSGGERRIRARLKRWRALLTEQVQESRDLLRQILVGPIQFTPVEQNGRRGNSSKCRQEICF
jgi:hypothetical protein